MFKKIFSFIIILFTITSLVYIFFSDRLPDFLTLREKEETALECAHGIDNRGNIYYIRKEQGKEYLVSLDSTGRQSYKKDISAIVGQNPIYDSIFIDQDRTLYLTVYNLERNASVVGQVGIYAFREDGSYITRIFNNKLQRSYDSKFRIVSAMSDDDKNIYFGFINGERIDIFTYLKNGSEYAFKTTEYKPEESLENINAFYVTDSGEAILSFEGGKLVKMSRDGNSKYAFETGSKVIIDRFWSAGSQFYCRDAVSGSIYISSSLKLDLSVAINGSKVISDEEEILFKQLDPIAIGNVGNVMGILENDGTHRIFLGGFAFLPEIGKTTTATGQDLNTWFKLIGIAAGIIIAALLIWDFYCSFLHMKLSILLRQALLVTLVIFIALHVLTERVIVPRSEEMLEEAYLAEQVKSGQMLVSAFKGFTVDEGGKMADMERAADLFDQFRIHQENSGDLQTDVEMKTSVGFIAEVDGQHVIIASDSRHEKGFPAVLLGYGEKFTEQLRKLEAESYSSFVAQTQKGRELCVLMPTDLKYNGAPVILSLVTVMDTLDRNTSDMAETVTLYMRLIGLVLVILVMIVGYLMVFNVRRLKKNVDKIAAGDYGRTISIRSGDEIEDLSNSIQALSSSILATNNSLNKLNASYHRFVPQRFMEMLGEKYIENVGKKSQAYKEDVGLLFLRFRFLTSMGKNSEEIFSNINHVFGNVMPIVSQNNGTVYNFLPNGFNAVFENGSEEMLKTALRIREASEALNQQRKRNGLGEVDVRIFITKDDIMLGFIGEEKRMEPAAISNASQKAEPVAQICFESDIYIACTSEVLEELPKGVYKSRRIGEVMLQDTKTELFDLYDSDPYALQKTKEIHADRFELGVRLFAKGDYANARNMFMDIIKYSSLDGATRNYMYIAEHNLRSDHVQSTYTTIRELERMR